MKKLPALIALLFVSPLTVADWAVKGEGNFSCPDYVAAKRSNGAKMYSSVTWVQGFISGINYQAALEEGRDSMVGRDYPATSIVQWLANYCNENPQDYLSDAAEALVVRLRENES